MAQKRDASMDFLRLIATIAVVGLHSVRKCADMTALHTAAFYALQFAVPVFFMCSGYFMLNRASISWRSLGRKLLGLLRVAVFWEIVLLFTNPISSWSSMRWQPMGWHLWFLGALAGVYLLTPATLWLLRRKGTRALVGMLCALGAVCVALHTITLFTGSPWYNDIPQYLLLWDWMFYYLLGLAMRRIEPWLRRHISLPLNAVLLAAAMLADLFGHHLLVQRYDIMPQLYYDTPVKMLYCLLLFALIHRLDLRPRLAKIVAALEPLSMGCFLIHPFVQRLVFEFVPQPASLGAFVWWWILCAVSFALSWFFHRFAFSRLLVSI